MKLPGLPVAFPPVVSLILAAALAVVEALNEVVFKPSSAVHAYIVIGVAFLGMHGVTALKGGLFSLAARLPQWVNSLIAAALGGLTLLLTTDHSLSPGVHAVIGDVVAVVIALGLGRPALATVTLHLDGAALGSAVADRS